MDPKKVLRSICDDLRFDVNTYNGAYKVYEMALRKGFDKKYKYFDLVCGALYFFCKSTGKPIILNKILDLVPDADKENVTSVYNEIKRYTLK